MVTNQGVNSVTVVPPSTPVGATPLVQLSPSGSSLSTTARTFTSSPRSVSQPITPIANISTKTKFPWAIMGRVTFKGPVTPYSNGKRFTFDLTDLSGSIRLVAFNAQCKQWYKQLVLNNVYQIENGYINKVNEAFRTVNSPPHFYTITIGAMSKSQDCTTTYMLPSTSTGIAAVNSNHIPPLPTNPFSDFVKLEQLELMPIQMIIRQGDFSENSSSSTANTNPTSATFVNLLAVISSIGPVEEFHNNRRLVITLEDDSYCKIELALWNGFINNIEHQPPSASTSAFSSASNVSNNRIALIGRVVYLRCLTLNSSVVNSNVRFLSTNQSSMFLIEPPELKAECDVLSAWFTSSTRANHPMKQLSMAPESDSLTSPFGTLSSLVPENMRFVGQITLKLVKSQAPNDQSTSIIPSLNSNVNVTIIKVSHHKNHFYESCTSINCARKVTQLQNKLYHCPTCNTKRVNFNWRLLVSIQISDGTGSLWVSLSQERIERYIGLSVNQLRTLFNTSRNGLEYKRKFDDSFLFKQFDMRLTTKSVIFQGANRLTTNVTHFMATTGNVGKTTVKRSQVLMCQIKKLAFDPSKNVAGLTNTTTTNTVTMDGQVQINQTQETPMNDPLINDPPAGNQSISVADSDDVIDISTNMTNQFQDTTTSQVDENVFLLIDANSADGIGEVINSGSSIGHRGENSMDGHQQQQQHIHNQESDLMLVDAGGEEEEEEQDIIQVTSTGRTVSSQLSIESFIPPRDPVDDDDLLFRCDFSSILGSTQTSHTTIIDSTEDESQSQGAYM